MDDMQTIVIGGGLAGLTAAATLARAGRPVTVLESGEHLGGRARTRRRDGFELNVGPHALYRRGGGLATLHDLGVQPKGRMPRLLRAGVLVDGDVTTVRRHLRRSVEHPARVARAMIGLGEQDAASWEGRPADEWLDQAAPDPVGRALLASALRTATYTADHALLDAAAATRQLRAAAHGVLYLHHGWSSLVDSLADVIRSCGGMIRTRVVVTGVEHDRAVRSVRLAHGTTLRADAVVLAVNDPGRAAGLLDGPGEHTLRAATAAVVGVRMAHLDVALRPLPTGRFPNVLGIDDPVYLTVQSDVAAVAPPDGAVLTIGRYLRPDEESGDHRAVLEHALDVVEPGWRDNVVDARYVPRSMVAADHARPMTRGGRDRPTVDVAGVEGLAVAGDWVGPVGTLADASILSGHAAATAIMDRMSGRLVPA